MEYGLQYFGQVHPARGDRWRWVQRGIELLRDEGLRYNPNDILLYRELGWFFQHKMGANLDDANMYYKEQWMEEMTHVFGGAKPNLDELIHPQTADQTNRARLLRDKYKMDPVMMKEVDQEYGPLEWRLPDSSAIYWAALGLKEAKLHPDKVKSDDLIMLRRVIYQSMQLSFQRGRLIANPLNSGFDLGPNLDIIPKVVAAYEQAMTDDPSNRDHISKAHRNLLRDAVYFLYVNDRIADAAKWFKYLGEKYPDLPIIDNRPDSLPRNVTLDEYAAANIDVDINETSRDKVKANLEGLLTRYYQDLLSGEDEHAAGTKYLAQQVWNSYQRKIGDSGRARIGLPTIPEIELEIRTQLLDPKGPVPPVARALLRTKLGLGPEPPPSESSTNSVPATSESATNSVPASTTAP